VAEQGERVLTMADGKLVSDRPGRTREQPSGSPAEGCPPLTGPSG